MGKRQCHIVYVNSLRTYVHMRSTLLRDHGSGAAFVTAGSRVRSGVDGAICVSSRKRLRLASASADVHKSIVCERGCPLFGQNSLHGVHFLHSSESCRRRRYARGFVRLPVALLAVPTAIVDTTTACARAKLNHLDLGAGIGLLAEERDLPTARALLWGLVSHLNVPVEGVRPRDLSHLFADELLVLLHDFFHWHVNGDG